ncbi:DUF6923 family protein [Microbacterium sp. A84]|uniref:DUF6923 family protein n=1 Tax=Microbacterium sp. A84 TaxID=3450715 RepID=UPI003F4334DB
MPHSSSPSPRVRRLPRAARAALLFGFALLSVAVPSANASTAALAATTPAPAPSATSAPVPSATTPAVPAADEVDPAPGGAFDPLYPQVFIGQNFPTTTLLGGQQVPGALALKNLGSTTDISYNAIGYNINDGFIYGIRANPNGTQNGTNHLVRVENNGVAVDLGVVAGLPSPTPKPTTGDRVNTYTQGTFGGITGPDGNSHILYVRDFNNTDNFDDMWAVNVETMTAEKITFDPISATISGVADFTWVGGQPYFPSRGTMFGASDTAIYGISEVDGFGWVVDSYHNPIPTTKDGRQFGAAWTLGNGRIGFSDNPTGDVFVLEISHDERGIVFDVAAAFSGPVTTNNDGTSVPGGNVDLGVVKEGPEFYAVGETLNYMMTVTNHGPHASSGSILTDTPPEGLGEVTSTTPGCTVADERHLTCVLGALPVGASTEVNMTAKVLTEITHSLGSVINSAHVLGNEEDPNMDNNSDSTRAAPYPGILERTKTSDPVSGTHVTPGQLVTYELTFHNAGRSPVVVDQVDLLADVLDDADLEDEVVAEAPLTATMSESEIAIIGTLPAGATATVRYSMQVKSPLPATASGKLGNFLVTKGDPPPPTCDPVTELCTEHPVQASLTWNKVNDQTPAVNLAGSEWTLTPYDRASTPALVPAASIHVIDCVAETDADCTGADTNSAEGEFEVGDLPIGTYQLAETRAPAGYQQIQPIDIAVYENVSFGDIVNTPVEVPTLPLTGGMGTTMFWTLTGGFGIVVLAAFILQQRRRTRT